MEILLSKGNNVWILQSSIHDEAPTSERALTLRHHLIKGQTRWGAVTKVLGEFCFTDCYWEWLDFVVGWNAWTLYDAHLFGAVTASLYTYDRNSDVVRAFCEAWCPSTNTLHTMAGELSISLWDMWSFEGLPIKGEFYEKVIPSYRELIPTRDKKKCLSITCQYLFQAYYSIIRTQRDDHKTSSKNDSQVTISSWISFWYLGSRSYDKSVVRKQKKASCSRFTQNPDGLKVQSREWSSRENMLFIELGIRDDMKDATYLAAFLSCWLCLFVFLHKGSFLCLGVFRIASSMADRSIYSLAVSILANIYHGLS